MKNRTYQEAFDIVWKRAKILKKAETESGGCVYRMDQHVGRRGSNCCFVGALMDSRKYAPHFEGVSPQLSGNSYVDKKPTEIIKACGLPATRETAEFLCKMQSVHDSLGTERWQTGLTAVAVQFGLVLPT